MNLLVMRESPCTYLVFENSSRETRRRRKSNGYQLTVNLWEDKLDNSLKKNKWNWNYQ